MRTGLQFYIIGIIIMTFGIALTIQSALGASPFDALLVGLHRTYGLTVGSWEIVVGLTMVLGNALVVRRKPEYFAIITSFVTGVGIDAWLFLTEDWLVPVTWIGQAFCLGLGLIFIGLGVACYLQSSFAPNPMDRSMLVISELTGWSVTYSRGLISIILVVIAYFFNGAIGVGTLINAVISGMLIRFFLPYVEAVKNRKKKDKLAS